MSKRYDLWGVYGEHDQSHTSRSVLWSDDADELVTKGWELLRMMHLHGELHNRFTVFDNFSNFPTPSGITWLEIICDLGFL